MCYFWYSNKDSFYVTTLIYSFCFYLLLRIYDLVTSRVLIPSDTHKRDCLPDTEIPSLTQYEAVLFPIFFQINSHVGLSGTTFVVPPRASTHLLASTRQVSRFNAFSTRYPNAQVRNNVKAHHRNQDTRFILTPRYDKEKPKQLQHKILWKRSERFKPNNHHIARPFFIQKFWLVRSGQVSPAPKWPNFTIQVNCYITVELSLPLSILLDCSICVNNLLWSIQ